ncbi:hypothetical protein ACFPOU_04945 [Massilia jejuensis]|uniref:Competence protein CoiA-like protein n=1 Tax=Massilia jejuensis TaxID=648894 RepID=A0ABW0PEJ8_9BURK
MTDPAATHITVRRPEQVRTRLQDNVLAWARDAGNGQLRYIMELGEHERGRASGCVCISCNKPLHSVNAAKVEWRNRPHFRHESGTEPQACKVLSARAALLASLHEGDVIVLPRLRRSIAVWGLSGAPYEGWIDVAPQPVHVGKLRFIDSTTAEVVLADGRRLRVVVSGRARIDDTEAGETLEPQIEICIDDPALAEMSPEELRARLVPAIEKGAWCGHWPDAAGDAAAREEAKRAAGYALDWDEDLTDLPADLRRESLLHREVKAILERANSVLLPGWWLTSVGAIATDKKRTERVQLAGARLERKLGRIIPDVIAQLKTGGELLVEVTVTNTITAERLERIRAVDLATIELDFSHMAGALSRPALRQLVLHEVAGKVWLHHPSVSKMPGAPQGGFLELGSRRRGTTGRTKQQMLEMTEQDCARQYLAAVRELARLDFEVDEQVSTSERNDALAAVLEAADALHVHGYPEALDYRLFDDQRTVLHRLMSLMMGYPVAYRYSKVWQVINSMLMDTGIESKSWHGLYHLAIKARGPALGLTKRQDELVDEWRSRVRTSVMQREDTYRRDPQYDRLFTLLFPELVPGLDNVSLRRAPAARTSLTVGNEPDLVGVHLSREPGIMLWKWTLPPHGRGYELGLAASRARIDGWTVDDSSILYHLVREKFSTPFVSTMAHLVAEKVGAEPAAVLRFLSRHGFISLSPKSGGL